MVFPCKNECITIIVLSVKLWLAGELIFGDPKVAYSNLASAIMIAKLTAEL